MPYRRAALAVLGTLAATSAFAHAGAGGGSGFAAGFAHPLAGLDHFLAMLAVGLVAVAVGGRGLWALPAAFIGAMLLGAAAAALAVPAILVEGGIALSLVAFGAAVAFGPRFPLAPAMVLVAGFALLHGHAHGAEMPAGATPLFYAAGFAAATALLHTAGIAAALAAGMRTALLRAAGVGITASGIVLALS